MTLVLASTRRWLERIASPDEQERTISLLSSGVEPGVQLESRRSAAVGTQPKSTSFHVAGGQGEVQHLQQPGTACAPVSQTSTDRRLQPMGTTRDHSACDIAAPQDGHTRLPALPCSKATPRAKRGQTQHHVHTPQHHGRLRAAHRLSRSQQPPRPHSQPEPSCQGTFNSNWTHSDHSSSSSRDLPI